MSNVVTVKDGNQIVGKYTTIQAAVDAAQNGDTISVSAGVYKEQVTDDGKNLTITGAGEGKTIIESPASADLVSNVHASDSPRPDKYAVVGAKDNASLTISGVTIDGRNQGNIADPNGYDFVGIDATNATLHTSGIDVKNIQETPNPDGSPSGNQRNSGIILDDNDGVARTDSITATSVEHFQKNGIATYGAGLTTNLVADIITGAGDISSTAQNGVEYLNGATGSVQGSTFKGIDYTGAGTTATDILVENATSKFTVAANLILGDARAAKGGSLGVYLEGTDGGAIYGNSFTNIYQGIENDPGPGQHKATIGPNAFYNVPVHGSGS